MASDKTEIEVMLANVDAKIAALVRVRESLVAAAAVGAFGQVGDFDPGTPPTGVAAQQTASTAPAQATGPIDLPTGVFRGKGLADAVRLYLSIAKRKQTFKDIKAALMDGGLATTSAFFDQTLNGTLHRLRKNGELLQFPDGWDLADSYPEGFRQRLAQSEPKSKKRKAKKKAAATSRAPKTADKSAEPTLRAV
jgi:hypothetical protein